MTHPTYIFCFALIHLTFGQLIGLGQGTINTQRLSTLLPNAGILKNIPNQPYTLGPLQTNTLARNLGTSTGYAQGISGNRQGITGNGQGIGGNGQSIPGYRQGITGYGQGNTGNRQGIADNGQAIAGNGFANLNTIASTTSIKNTSPYIANAPTRVANTNIITGKDNTDIFRTSVVNSGITNQVPSNISSNNFKNAKVIKYELGISQDDSNIASNISKNSHNINIANSGRKYGLKVDADDLKMVGDVTVNGKLPIYGTVGLNGILPTKGAGNVEFSC